MCFPAASKRRRYCSPECKCNRNKVEFKCIMCGILTVVPNYTNHKKKFCSNKCSSGYKAMKTLERNICLFKLGKLKNRRNIRKVLFSMGVEYKCSRCGLTEWLGKPIVLWLDHIDGNASNNIRSNFRFVCPNCDSQSVTFGSKNYGNGRRSLGLSPYA